MTSRARRKEPPLRCPDCHLFVSAAAVYSELDYIDTDESNQRAWFDYVPCTSCGGRDRCLGFSEPL